jgi:capsular exopolysaccharide synthesis family protein
MQEFEFKLIDVLDVLRKYYLIIIGCATVFTAISFIFNYYVFAKVYGASTTLYVWKSAGEATANNSSTAYRDIVFYDRLINDYKQLIESKRVKRTVNELLMVKSSIYQTFKQEKDKKSIPYTIIVSLKRNTRMIKISAQSPSPELACMAANSTAAIFIDTVKSMMQMDNIKILDVAEVPRFAIKPNKIRNVFIGFILGVCAGFGIGFILKLLDNTIKTPEEVTAHFKLPMLGMVPQFAIVNKGKLLQRTGRIREFNIISPNNKDIQFTEAFKVVRNNIQYSSPDKPIKVVMVSSADPAAGKTTCTGNLALSFAMSGKKVLVIDCDLRKPSIHLVFGIENNCGIVDCLIHKASVQEAIQHDVLDGVDIMTCGNIPPNPSELLMSETFQQTIASLEESYDYIFLDAPPAAINLADPAIIGRVTDGCIFILRANQTKYDSADHAIEQLLQVDGNKIIGVILNHFVMKGAKYCSYYMNES